MESYFLKNHLIQNVKDLSVRTVEGIQRNYVKMFNFFLNNFFVTFWKNVILIFFQLDI